MHSLGRMGCIWALQVALLQLIRWPVPHSAHPAGCNCPSVSWWRESCLCLSSRSAEHLQVVLLGLAFIPCTLIPFPSLQRFSTLLYRLFFQAALAGHILRLVRTFGVPPIRPFSLAALKDYFLSLAATSDSHYGMIAFMYMAQRPFHFLMISPFLLASMRFASALQSRVPAAKPLCDKLLTKKVRSSPLLAAVQPHRSAICTLKHLRIVPSESILSEASCVQKHVFSLMATVDILALPMMIINCVITRSFLGPIVYVQMLRTRYHTPAGAPYHQPAWSVIGEKVEPLLQKLPSAVQNPVRWVQRWFTQVPGAPPA